MKHIIILPRYLHVVWCGFYFNWVWWVLAIYFSITFTSELYILILIGCSLLFDFARTLFSSLSFQLGECQYLKDGTDHHLLKCYWAGVNKQITNNSGSLVSSIGILSIVLSFTRIYFTHILHWRIVYGIQVFGLCSKSGRLRSLYGQMQALEVWSLQKKY